jgi:hypothetical protein
MQEQITLFTVPSQPRSRTSDVILQLMAQAKQGNVTLGSLTERLGDRTFGMLLIILAVINLIPFISIIAGLLVLSLGLQMTLGFTKAKLPKFILDRQLPNTKVYAALNAFEPKIRHLEQYIRPRWLFTEAPIVDRLNGAVLMLLGIIISLPIPFTNIIPALIVILMGMGLLERDGLVQIVSAVLGLIAMWLIYSFIIAGFSF